jgi:multisubunit Na+/H+ antiporter MnhB subunit
MIRGLGVVALAIVAVWVVAHVLYIGPVQDAAEVTLVWALGIAAASLVGAALVLLAVAIVLGNSRPAWLRFVRTARTVAAVVGCALILVGLLHYRDTEPQGEIHWVVFGLLVLAGAGVVHWWVVRAVRRQTA